MNNFWSKLIAVRLRIGLTYFIFLLLQIEVLQEIPPINHVLAMNRRCLNFEGDNLIKKSFNFQVFWHSSIAGRSNGLRSFRTSLHTPNCWPCSSLLELEFISYAEVRRVKRAPRAFIFRRVWVDMRLLAVRPRVLSKTRVAYVVRTSIKFSETFKRLFTYVYYVDKIICTFNNPGSFVNNV